MTELNECIYKLAKERTNYRNKFANRGTNRRVTHSLTHSIYSCIIRSRFDSLSEYDSDCGSPSWKKDGSCDDENNFADCDYDGGDCCMADIIVEYCDECLCKEPGIFRAHARTHDTDTDARTHARTRTHAQSLFLFL